MEIFQAIILGIIEGLTEFLPISSTGHLIVAQDVLNYKDTAEIFTVVVQSGAILAVIWFYRSDLIQKTRGLVNRDEKSINFWINWVIATIPAGMLGFALKDTITAYAGAITVAISMILGGFVILLIESYHKVRAAQEPSITEITRTQAVKVGLFQMIALIPGVSRSGATIMGGLLSGLDRPTATAFSFYLSIPILVVAGIYQLGSGRHELNTVEGGMGAIIVGSIASFITALIAIKWLLHYVSKHDFKIFAYYRIVVGLIILITLAVV